MNGREVKHDFYFDDGWQRWRGNLAENELLLEAGKNPLGAIAFGLMPNQEMPHAGAEFFYLPQLHAFGEGGQQGQANDPMAFYKLLSPDPALLESKLDLAKYAGNNDLATKLASVIETRRAVAEHYRFPVRQYAHQHRTGDDPNVRSDFADTLYWNPLLVADASGRA